MLNSICHQVKRSRFRVINIEILFLETTAVIALGVSIFIGLGCIYGDRSASAANPKNEQTLIAAQSHRI